MKNSNKLAQSRSTSITKQYDLLVKIVQHPEDINENLRQELLPALSSQGALAYFSYPTLGIVAMSLNTHKAVANMSIKGGYYVFNTYRKSALNKLKELSERQERPTRGTIDWYQAELAEKTESIARMANDIALMSKRLDEVLDLAYQMAVSSDRLDEFQKRRGELLRKFK